MMRFSDTEWKVMTVVWERAPVSVREVLEALEADTGWAYSTVKTLLARLADKGAVSSTMRGNSRLFSPTLSRDVARRSAVRSLLDRAFDGTLTGLVHHLVEERTLTERERDELKRVLDEAERDR